MSELNTIKSNESARGKRAEIMYYCDDVDKLKDLTPEELDEVFHKLMKLLMPYGEGTIVGRQSRRFPISLVEIDVGDIK